MALLTIWILAVSSDISLPKAKSQSKSKNAQYWVPIIDSETDLIIKGKALTYSEALVWVSSPSGIDYNTGNVLFGNNLLCANYEAALAIAINYPGYVLDPPHQMNYLWHFHQNNSRSNGDVHIWFTENRKAKAGTKEKGETI